jgi:hypothetical protein
MATPIPSLGKWPMEPVCRDSLGSLLSLGRAATTALDIEIHQISHLSVTLEPWKLENPGPDPRSHQQMIKVHNSWGKIRFLMGTWRVYYI